ncbi:MAG: hypothetical protein ABEJ91_02345 [Candidatus Nanohaloarchaea archaeon]
MKTSKGMATQKTMAAVIAVGGAVFFLAIWMSLLNSQGDVSGCSPIIQALGNSLDQAAGIAVCGG